MKRRAQPWLGTLVEVSIPDGFDDARGFRQAFAAVAEVHRLMSFHDPDSDVSRINRAAVGATIEVAPATWTVLQSALALGRASGGMFDIGCAPALVAWGYLPGAVDAAEAWPDRVAAHEALHSLGYCRLEKREPAWIDLGGIAKGHAVDAAIVALQREGVPAGCVNAGGDLRAFGDIDFPVLVRDPGCPTAAGARLMLRNEAIATSANYFSRKRLDGAMVSALVDGRNARPLTTAVSASVRAPACMIADALTKVVLASGDAGHPLLRSFDASAFIIGHPAIPAPAMEHVRPLP